MFRPHLVEINMYPHHASKHRKVQRSIALFHFSCLTCLKKIYCEYSPVSTVETQLGIRRVDRSQKRAGFSQVCQIITNRATLRRVRIN